MGPGCQKTKVSVQECPCASACLPLSLAIPSYSELFVCCLNCCILEEYGDVTIFRVETLLLQLWVTRFFFLPVSELAVFANHHFGSALFFLFNNLAHWTCHVTLLLTTHYTETKPAPCHLTVTRCYLDSLELNCHMHHLVPNRYNPIVSPLTLLLKINLLCLF